MKQIFIVILIFSTAVGVLTVVLKDASGIINIPGISSNNGDASAKAVGSFYISSKRGAPGSFKEAVFNQGDLQTSFYGEVKKIVSYLDEHGNLILLSATNKGAYYSVDRGKSWRRIFDEFISGNIYDITIDDSKNLARLIIAGLNNRGVGTIFVSSDGGVSFEETYVSHSSDDPVIGATFDVDDPRIVYAVTKKGLFLESNDRGASWRSRLIELIDEQDENDKKDVEESQTQGDVAAQEQEQEEVIFTDLISYPFQSSILFVLTNQGLYRSDNHGDIWKSLNGALDRFSGAKNIHSFSVNENFSTIYVGSDYGLLSSDTQGASFVNVSFTIPSHDKRDENSDPIPVTAVALDPRDDTRIYVGVGNKLYITENRGVSWRSFTIGGLSGNMKLIAINNFNANLVFISSSN